MKSLSALTESEVLALAIANEEEDLRIYHTFAEKIRKDFPASAGLFDEMAEEEREHRDPLRRLPVSIRRASAAYQARGRARLLKRRPSGLENLDLERMRREAEAMELQAANFYDSRRRRRRTSACASCSSISPRSSAAMEAGRRSEDRTSPPTRNGRRGEPARLPPAIYPAGTCRPDRRLGLDARAALRGGLRHAATTGRPSSSASPPRSAPASRWDSRKPLSDDGRSPGAAPGHARPRLRPDDGPRRPRPHPALSRAARQCRTPSRSRPARGRVVASSSSPISLVRTRYMDTPLLRAAFQVVIGGILVLVAGILIGSA